MARDNKASSQLFHRRHAARKLAMQALYQWQVGGQAPGEILAQFREDIDYPKTDSEYFEELLERVTGTIDEVDSNLKPYMNRDIGSVDPVERAILRLAAYELANRQDIPGRVVLNEAISLAKMYGATDGHKFINGVLDKTLAKLRGTELAAKRS